MEEIMNAAHALLGIGREDLGVAQMSLRAAVVYVIAIAIVRLGKKRFMDQATAFDLILAVVLGSIVSRVITGDAPFVPGLIATLTLVAMHWLFSAMSLHWRAFDVLVKGHPRILVQDGTINWDEMRKAHLTRSDLYENLRVKGVWDPSQVAEARLERSGEISVLGKG